jgi:tRNA (Thr-GGU) A37 N-methylase
MALRKIAKWSNRDDGCILFDVLPPLNKECLRGMLDWSHCWLIFKTEASDMVDTIVCKILSQKDRRLVLSPITPLPITAQIVDIKPYHFLESSTSSAP